MSLACRPELPQVMTRSSCETLQSRLQARWRRKSEYAFRPPYWVWPSEGRAALFQEGFVVSGKEFRSRQCVGREDSAPSWRTTTTCGSSPTAFKRAPSGAWADCSRSTTPGITVTVHSTVVCFGNPASRPTKLSAPSPQFRWRAGAADRGQHQAGDVGRQPCWHSQDASLQLQPHSLIMKSRTFSSNSE